MKLPSTSNRIMGKFPSMNSNQNGNIFLLQTNHLGNVVISMNFCSLCFSVIILFFRFSLFIFSRLCVARKTSHRHAQRKSKHKQFTSWKVFLQHILIRDDSFLLNFKIIFAYFEEEKKTKRNEIKKVYIQLQRTKYITTKIATTLKIKNKKIQASERTRDDKVNIQICLEYNGKRAK